LTKLWRLALGVVIVAGIVVWDVGLPGRHASTNTSAASPSASARLSASPSSSASASTAVPQVAGLLGVIKPHGAPEFSATFTGTNLNKSVWATCYPYPAYVFGTGCMNFGNVGNENQWYLPSQVQLRNGTLNLVAKRTQTAGNAANGSPKTYACRSGMVTTYPGFRFKYGYVQVVARIPAGKGLWPALWLAAANLQWPPEMDILEAWGSGLSNGQTYAAMYFHYSTPTNHDAYIKAVVSPPARAIGWHTFALSWTRTQMTWLLDGKPVLTTSQHVPRQKMFLIANLAEAVSRSQPNVLPGECSGEMQIRSVQVWAP
jgi:beta-glucanase (GH16 family)